MDGGTLGDARGVLRIGVVGDLHAHWDEIDVAQFNRSDYDLLLFTGDLGGGSRESGLRMARLMARLTRPSLVMPGNNDTSDVGELAAELAHRAGIRHLRRLGVDGLGKAPPATVALCGYSLHRIRQGDLDLTLIAARPHSMGGPELSFRELMADVYGIEDMDASTRRLLSLVDAVETEQLLFLAHNGPAGLGDHADDIWGCDFRPGGGDWGDPDLTVAIDHARRSGRRVLAVVAGHMHLRTRTGGERPWRIERDGITYVNAARVPRIFAVGRHHVAVTVDGDAVDVREVITPGG